MEVQIWLDIDPQDKKKDFFFRRSFPSWCVIQLEGEQKTGDGFNFPGKKNEKFICLFMTENWY